MDVMKRSQKRHSLVEISRIKWLQDSNPRPSSQFEFSSVFTVAFSVLKVDSLQAVPSVLVFSGPISGYRQAAQNHDFGFLKAFADGQLFNLSNQPFLQALPHNPTHQGLRQFRIQRWQRVGQSSRRQEPLPSQSNQKALLIQTRDRRPNWCHHASLQP